MVERRKIETNRKEHPRSHKLPEGATLYIDYESRSRNNVTYASDRLDPFDIACPPCDRVDEEGRQLVDEQQRARLGSCMRGGSSEESGENGGGERVYSDEKRDRDAGVGEERCCRSSGRLSNRIGCWHGARRRSGVEGDGRGEV